MEKNSKLFTYLNLAIHKQLLKKIIFSRPNDKSVIKEVCRPINIKNISHLQFEKFTADGKAFHKNFLSEEAIDIIFEKLNDYRQINIITTGGNVEARISSKGKLSVIGSIGEGVPVPLSSHNRKKSNILSEDNVYGFLVALGVSDEQGRVFDKKRAKFRQIDRFLHYINDIYPKLPQNGTLYVLDLCCGKSYLTFATYWFLTEIKKRCVRMIGADLKKDVIEFCNGITQKLGYSNLSFICCDITEYTPEFKPSLVLSLHACDTATDIVLTTAARINADVILSTPCCHHFAMSEMKKTSKLGKDLSAVIEHSLLKQKLCVALTDALRCKRLQAAGYSVDVTELIDPENTPKNLLIRAVKCNNISPDEIKNHISEYRRLEAICGFELPFSPKYIHSDDNR